MNEEIINKEEVDAINSRLADWDVPYRCHYPTNKDFGKKRLRFYEVGTEGR